MNDEATRLARRARTLTRHVDKLIEQREATARERAHVWREAVAAGASQRQLAIIAGVDPCQVAKALERYGTNGES